MGNSQSKKESCLSNLKTQVTHLGNRCPFGDNDILRLSRCHAYLLHHSRQRRRQNRLQRRDPRNINYDKNSTISSNYDEKSIPSPGTSFLTDWAIFASTLPPPNYSDPDYSYGNVLHIDGNMFSSDMIDTESERCRMEALMSVVEGQILPTGFGRKLECISFALPGDSPSDDLYYDHEGSNGFEYQHGDNEEGDGEYTRNSVDGKRSETRCCCPPGNSAEIRPKKIDDEEEEDRLIPKNPRQTQLQTLQNEEEEEDPAIGMKRLEQFLVGAAECTKRGTRKALAVMFRCCADAANTTSVHVDGSTIHQGNEYGSYNVDGGNVGTTALMASANDLIDLGYRLSLATAFLIQSFSLRQYENYDDRTIMSDPSPFYPQEMKNPLVQSLLEFSTRRSTVGGGTYGYGGMTTPMPTSSKNVKNDLNLVTMETFIEWAESTAPCLSGCLETFMHYIFFPDKPYPSSRTGFFYPNLRGQQSAFFAGEKAKASDPEKESGDSSVVVKSRSSPLLFSFACMSPALGGAWHRLYTSDSDGLSFNRLQNSLLGYSGPTLLIVRESKDGGMFGAFTSTAWKETKDFYGNSDCFLFRLKPSVAVYRPRGAGSNYMYCNSESRSRGYDGLPHGIGFGGTTEKPRLFIAESFDGCMASSGDLTFEAGALLPPPKVESGIQQPARKYFDIESLEVWGVGGDDVVAEALGARAQQREITAANIRKARKVDKAQFLDDFKSGLIESKAFQHREQMRGRADCHVDDNDPRNYVYEK